MQGLVDQHTAALDRQQKMVERDLSETHTLDDLKTMLAEFDGKVEEHTLAQDNLESLVHDLNDRIDTMHKREMDLKTKLGKLESEKETFQTHLRQRVQLMEAMASSYSFSLLDYTQTQAANSSFRHSLTTASPSADTNQLAEISPEDMQNFFQKMSEIKLQLEDDLRNHREKVVKEEDILQKELIEIGGKLGALQKGE